MSPLPDGCYQWFETYYVLCDRDRVPTGDALRHALARHSDLLRIEELKSDDTGRFESATIIAPTALCALELRVLYGEEVLEHGAALSEELADACPAADRPKLARLEVCDARIEVQVYEQLVEPMPEEEATEADEEQLLDPAALLTVVRLLVKLSEGVAVDPQAATFL
ncbi:MAG: hypothetical protein HYS13_12325 [Planctomycetia bacterium]|nr:hypothetical protein [Planctomycetia bacterium]